MTSPGFREGAGRRRWAAAVVSLGVALLAWAAPAGAEWVATGGGVTGVRLIEQDGDRLVLEARVGGFEREPVLLDGHTHYRIRLPHAAGEPTAGEPDLPDLRATIAIPPDRAMRVRVIDAEWIDVPGTPVAPSPGVLPRDVDPASVPHRFSETYHTPGLHPAEPAVGRRPFILRDVRGMVVECNVMQADPLDETLRVFTRMVLEVAPDGPARVNRLDRAFGTRPVDPQFARLYRDRFLNLDAHRYEPLLETGGLLIIAHDAFVPDVAPLRDWKLQKGIPTSLVAVSEIGDRPEDIRDYIRDAYQTQQVAYVLLVGDAPQVPTFIVSNGASDPSYALLEGEDAYPEVFVGRFSAETAEHVALQVARTIAYERDLATDALWLASGMGAASNEGPGHFFEWDWEHADLIRDDLLAYGYDWVDRIYQPEGTAADVTAAVEEGRGIINYTGHGSPTSWGSSFSGWVLYTNDDVDALHNVGLWPFIDTVGCAAGRFQDMTCFAEAWLRASHEGQPAGAVAAYMSATNQYWRPPMDAQDEFVDLLVADSMRTAGGLWFNGACWMMDLWGEDGELMFKTWHIFGDPSVVLRSAVPRPMGVNHAGALPIGQTTYAVEVTHGEGALTALYADGHLYGSALTDASGRAVVTLNPPLLEPAALTLTVTAPNRVTRQAPVSVIAEPGAHLVVRDIAWTDEGGDGQADAGEQLGLQLLLANIGGATAQQVAVHFDTDDTYLDLLAEQAEAPAIAPGDSAWTSAAVGVVLSPEVPDEHLAQIELSITAEPGLDWPGSVTFGAHAGAPRVGVIAVDDATGGNGDLHLQAGEAARIAVELGNEGSGFLRDLAATLSSAHPLVAVTGAVAGTDLLSPGGLTTLDPPFELSVDPAYELPFADLHLALSGAGGTTFHLEVRVPVGGFWDPVEADTSLWSHEPVTPEYLDQWHLSTADNHTPGGTQCWRCGPPDAGSYAPLLDAGLETPVLDLAGFGELRFWMRIDAEESPIHAGKAPDGGFVEAGAPGAIMAQITPEGGYTHQTIMSQTLAVLGNVPVFSGQADWRPVRFDLSGLSGPTVFRFRFVSDEGEGGAGWFIDDVEVIGVGDVQGVGPGDAPPTALTLHPARPNPSALDTRLTFTLPRSGRVTLDLIDPQGRLVRRLVDGPAEAGTHRLSWRGLDGRDVRVPAGVYFARLRAGEEMRAVRVLRLR